MPYLTAEEWFRKIPDEKASAAAIENIANNTPDEWYRIVKKRTRYYSFQEALMGSFSWSATPQGNDYWQFIHKNAVIE
jgi:hypothetical protein